MPFRKGLLPREGLTADPIGRFIKRTAFNPLFTLAFLLAARFSQRGSDFAFDHPTALSRLRKLFYYGVFRWVSSYLDAGVLNNWTNDQYDWNREIVVVTGGAGGIGGQVVKLFAERGTKVVVLDVIPMTFEASSNVRYYKCDITSPATIKKVADQIRAEVGEPTVLINNAGVARGKSLLNSTEKDVRFTFEVNTFAHYWLAHEFLPSMVKNNHGMIVTVASLAAYLAVPNMVDYASSKAAALSFHEGITAELSTLYNAPKVRTVVVNQGYTRTPLFKGYNGGSPFLMPSLEVDTVAEAIVKKVLSGSSGQVIVPGAGAVSTLIRAMPHWYQIRVRSQGVKFMEKWDGRQVIDVEKWKGGKDAEDVSASTVLVDAAKE